MSTSLSPNLIVFSKHLAGPSLREVGERLAAMGIPAIDLTVRPGGHVEPARAADDLPAAAEALAASGVRIGMITTGITDASEPSTRIVLQAAVKLGIRHYKLGYYMYNGFGTLRQLRAEVRAKLSDLVALNRELGLHAGFHNHCDNFLGASLYDVEHLICGFPAEYLGSYLDPMHATVEGGSCGWKMGMDLLGPRVTMLAVKDFRWAEGKHRYAGGRRHSIEMCPLAEGNTHWPTVLTLLRKQGFDGPISLHSEYQGSHSFRDLSVDEVFAQTAEDAVLFRKWWEAAV